MADFIWYASYVDGRSPTCRRLLRAPLYMRREAAPHLALSMIAGHAEYRSLHTSRPGSPPETQVYWPDAPWPDIWTLAAASLKPKEIAKAVGLSEGTVRLRLTQPPSAWWLVPTQTIRQAETLIRQAERAAVHCTGRAMPEQIGRYLRRWIASGRWRRQLHVRSIA
jgi:hypothetical protein